MLRKTLQATMLIGLASFAFVIATVGPGMPAMADQTDQFGVSEIYPTKLGGQEWYVNMDNPTGDSQFRNLDNIVFSDRGDSWRVSADQIRMEAWSQQNQKWLNVEITEYAKIEGGSNELLQLYSRGGHHTDTDQCLGSAYKARLYGDGVAAWTKEITHPAYAGNRGVTQATDKALEGRWVGFKAVIYNFVENGNTYVRLESYIDDDVTDSSGNLVVKNNWKLASVVEDRGGWATDNGDFNSSCGRARDEILSGPGGTDSQNIAAFRSDDLTWDFKYLSVREVEPPTGTTASPEPQTPQPSAGEVPEAPSDPAPQLPEGYLIATSEQAQNGTTSIASIDMYSRKATTRTYGDLSVAIVQSGNVLATGKVEAATLDINAQQVSVPIGPVEVTGVYQIMVFFYGAGYISAAGIQPLP